MAYYLVLTSATIIIFFLQYLVWKKNKSFFLPLATFFLYYWSLLGAWFIVYDAQTNNAAAKIGAHYYDYFERLFPVLLNDDYFKALIYYSLFIISFQLVQLFLLKPLPKNFFEPEKKLQVKHVSLILISLTAIVASFLLIEPQLAGAYANDESFYLYINQHPQSGTYSLSQVLRTSSLVAASGGMVLLLIGSESKHFSITKPRFTGIYYGVLLTIVLLYVSALGNRHDLIYVGIFSLVLYSVDSKKKLRKHYALIILVTVLPVFLAELTRGIPLFSAVEDPFKPKFRLQDLNFLGTMLSLLWSNEMFVGHMSMYGATHFNLPLTHGSSFESLAASFIPRIINPNRPEDIYHYYISIAANPGTAGFTINHATGWYLNFGIAGIVAGGAILGSILCLVVNHFYSISKSKYTLLRFIQIIALPGLVAFIPILVRSGPEGYKALLLEGILFPAIIFWIAGLFQKSAR